jgi:hypothetical protein
VGAIITLCACSQALDVIDNEIKIGSPRVEGKVRDSQYARCDTQSLLVEAILKTCVSSPGSSNDGCPRAGFSYRGSSDAQCTSPDIGLSIGKWRFSGYACAQKCCERNQDSMGAPLRDHEVLLGLSHLKTKEAQAP